MLNCTVDCTFRPSTLTQMTEFEMNFSLMCDRPLSFVRTVHFETHSQFVFQKREDPVFESYKKIKATEERLNEELRSGFTDLSNDLSVTFE